MPYQNSKRLRHAGHIGLAHELHTSRRTPNVTSQALAVVGNPGGLVANKKTLKIHFSNLAQQKGLAKANTKRIQNPSSGQLRAATARSFRCQRRADALRDGA